MTRIAPQCACLFDDIVASVIDEQPMPGSRQACRHGKSHVPQTDESDVHSQAYAFVEFGERFAGDPESAPRGIPA